MACHVTIVFYGASLFPKNPFVMDEIVISVPKSKNVNPSNDNNETDNK